jgi:adenosylhomocysteine nucleosidase
MLDILLRNWLRNAAKQKVYEAAGKAAREQFAGNTEPREAEDRPAERQRPCDVGLVFALGIEAGGLEDRLSGAISTQASGFRFCQGGLQGRHVVLVSAGAGLKSAAGATEALIAGHHPSWIISAGFAGGLQPQLKRHDFLLASEVCDVTGHKLSIDLLVPPESLSKTPGVHVGKLLSVERIIHRAAEKESLGREHAALAVDMESMAVAEVCRQQKIRFLSVRIISDAMHEELPPDVDRLVRKKTTAGKLGAAVGAIAGRPSSLKDMLKLKEEALVATDRLAKFLEGVIVQLPPQEERTPSPEPPAIEGPSPSHGSIG